MNSRGENLARKASSIPTTATPAEPIECLTSRLQRQVSISTYHNCVLIWLDSSIDLKRNDDSKATFARLKEVIGKIQTFTSDKDFIDFVTKMERENFLIIASGSLGESTIPIVHNLQQISAVYIFCGNRPRHEQWAKHWAKIKGVFTDIAPICNALKRAAYDLDPNLISISFLPSNSAFSGKITDHLDASFIYPYLMKEIVVTMDFGPKDISNFIEHCQQTFNDNATDKKVMDKISCEYRHDLSIWWYTYQNFFYSILNRSIQTADIVPLARIGFFIHDLHNHIVALHKEQFHGHSHSKPFTVFRGQGLSKEFFDQLMESKANLLSFNTFLFTNTDQQVSVNLVHQIIDTSDQVGVLFKMKIDPSEASVAFANVCKVSYFEDDEILFDMHSIFHINKIEPTHNDRLWQIDLTLINRNNPELNDLIGRMFGEAHSDLRGWYRLGKLLTELNDFDKAQTIYDMLLHEATTDQDKADIYQQMGFIQEYQGHYDDAIIYYIQSSTALQNSLSPTDTELASAYMRIASVYDIMGDYFNALLFHQKTLDIDQHTLPPIHPDLASSYNNIGVVYDKMGDHTNALLFHQKAMEIYEKVLPSDHADLATSYNNIAWVYRNLGDHSKALKFYERALNIQKRILPPDHPDLQDVKKSITILKNK